MFQWRDSFMYIIVTGSVHTFLQAGVSPLLQHQFEELSKQKPDDERSMGESKRRKLVVIGQECVEPLQALRSAGQEVMLKNSYWHFFFLVPFI